MDNKKKTEINAVAYTIANCRLEDFQNLLDDEKTMKGIIAIINKREAKRL